MKIDRLLDSRFGKAPAFGEVWKPNEQHLIPVIHGLDNAHHRQREAGGEPTDPLTSPFVVSLVLLAGWSAGNLIRGASGGLAWLVIAASSAYFLPLCLATLRFWVFQFRYQRWLPWNSRRNILP